MRKVFISALVIVVLSGCAGQRQWTRDEALRATTRVYKGVSAPDVLSAAERIFRLADEGDTKFVHKKNEIKAQRQATIYGILSATIGTFKFQVQANELPEGTEVQIEADKTIESFPFGPTTNVPVAQVAVYELFFGRMDYLLGIKKDWVTCEEKGSPEELCLFADDKQPDGPLKRGKSR